MYKNKTYTIVKPEISVQQSKCMNC